MLSYYVQRMFNNFFVKKKTNRLLKLRRNMCYVITKKRLSNVTYVHTYLRILLSNVSLRMIIHTNENNDAKKLSGMIQGI